MNYIIKSRAYRYVAGRYDEDLFPERYLRTTAWNKLGKFLLPPKHEIGEFAGQTYAKMADGTYFIQDEFGRRPESKDDYNRKVQRAKDLEETVRIALEKKYGVKKILN